MKDIRMILPNLASDTAGAASLLFQLDGLSIIHDAAGSMESYITFDEPRNLEEKRTVASRLSRLEAITGDDRILLDKIETECADNPPPFVAIFGSPIPFTIGTDLDGIAAEAEYTTGIPAFAVNSGGFEIYDKGAGEALLKAIQKLTLPPAVKKPGVVNLLGATPMDYSPAELDDIKQQLLNSGAAQVNSLTMCDGIEELQHAAEAEHNLVISISGLPAAQYMQKKYQIPYTIGLPMPQPAGQSVGTETLPAKKILVIGESVFAKQMVHCLNQIAEFTAIAGIVGNDHKEIFPEVSCIRLDTEEKIFEELKKGYDAIIGDPMYRQLLPADCNCIFLERAHRALSARLYPFCEYKFENYITTLKGCFK